MLSGIFLVFAVLVLLYQRLLPPFVNMGSLLLAPLGGADRAASSPAMPLSMPVLIGMLMLLGIVAKNSILLIDFALEEMAKGVPKDEAIIDAGHKRAQPIVMTTVAMVAGMVPTALVAVGRCELARADGRRRDRRPDPFDRPHPGARAGAFSLAIGFEEWLGAEVRALFTYRGKQDHGRPAGAPSRRNNRPPV